MTAEDVAYSFTRVVSLQDQPSFILTQFGITPESLKAVDKYTVAITLDKKYASGIFFACLSAVLWIRRWFGNMSKRPTNFLKATLV